MNYVYILKSRKDNKLYTGFTKDLAKRLSYHSKGYCIATKHRRPLLVIYYEAYQDERDARKREKFLKSGKGREIIKIQIKNSILGPVA